MIYLYVRSLSYNMKDIKKIRYNSPGTTRLIDGFMQSTGAKFECATIAGRRFRDVGDHARYVREGGCAQLIEALAAGVVD